MTQKKQYLEWIRYGRKLSENSIKSIESDFNQFGDHLETATRQDIEMFIMDMNRRGLSTASVARRVSSVRNFKQWQLYNGLIDKDPTQGGRLSPRVSNKSHTTLSYKQLESLYSNSPNRNIRVAVGLMAYAGLRIGEVVELGVTNFVYRDENGVQAIYLKDTKGGKERKVSLALLPDEISNDPIKGQRGVYTSNGLWRILSKYFAEQGFKDLSPHGLRASYSTLLVQSDVRVDIVRDILGHSGIGEFNGNHITSRYVAAATVEMQAQALQQLQL